MLIFIPHINSDYTLIFSKRILHKNFSEHPNTRPLINPVLISPLKIEINDLK